MAILTAALNVPHVFLESIDSFVEHLFAFSDYLVMMPPALVDLLVKVGQFPVEAFDLCVERVRKDLSEDPVDAFSDSERNAP